MKRRHLKGMDLARSHPIAKAIAANKVTKQVREIRTRIYALQEGADARTLLTALGWLVSVGAEIAHATKPGSPTARRLHGALRQLVQMAAGGGRWQTAMAAPFYDAAVDAQTLLLRHPDIGLVMAPGATHLSTLIETGKATLANVAGAELYQPEPAGASA